MSKRIKRSAYGEQFASHCGHVNSAVDFVGFKTTGFSNWALNFVYIVDWVHADLLIAFSCPAVMVLRKRKHCHWGVTDYWLWRQYSLIGVSRCLLTAKVRVYLPGSPRGTCSGHMTMAQMRQNASVFPCQLLFHRCSLIIHLSSCGRTVCSLATVTLQSCSFNLPQE